MNRFRPLLILIAFLTILASCNEGEDMANLTFTLVPTYNGTEVTSGQVIKDVTGRNFSLTDLRMYITDITLLKANGSRLPVHELSLVEWPGSKSSISVTVPKDNYSGVEFHVGLDSVTNLSVPTSFDNDHPLSAQQDMHWGMLKYRFLIFTGQVDTSSGGNLTPGNLLVYHLGRDELYSKVTITRSLNLTGPAAFFSFNFEVNEMFHGTAGDVDIAVQRDNHSSEPDMWWAEIMMSNLVEAFEAD